MWSWNDGDGDMYMFPCRRSGMRRGMLMTVLHQYALEQPVWRGKPGERSAVRGMSNGKG